MDARLREGICLFNAGRYFESQESFEDFYSRAGGKDKPFVESLLLRAERAGLGNGRVYQIRFKAEDSFGESCIGTVTVCVPHDRRDGACGDDGQLYDSTTQ